MRFTVKELEGMLEMIRAVQDGHPIPPTSVLNSIEQKAKAEIAIRTMKVRRAVEKDQ